MKKVLIPGILVLVLIASILAACSPSPAPAPTSTPKATPTATPTPAATAKPAVPRMLTFASAEIGSSEQLTVALVADAIAEKFGVKTRVIPVANGPGRVSMVRDRLADIFAAGMVPYTAMEGLEEFAAMEWGPQPLQFLRLVQHPGFFMAVRGDSDIKTPADLKGKKVSYVVGLASYNLIAEAHLAFANLTWKDVTRVDFTSGTALQRAVMDGKADATTGNLGAPISYEWASMPYGMRVLPMPASDTAGWERARKVSPLYSPIKATIGASVSPEKPAETITYLMAPSPTVLESMDEETAYFITKAMEETYSIYGPKSETLGPYATMKVNWERFDLTPVPFHKGAVRYYKEIGQWTPQREELNNKRIARQKALQQLWPKVVEQALTEKIKAADFPAYWLKKRAEAGF